MKKWVKEHLYSLYIAVRYLYYRVLLVLIPSNVYISKRYKKKFGENPNLNNPQTYNEKLLWLMLNWENNQARICADKYLVRNYVKEKIGAFILNDLYQIAEKAEDINFEALPQKFVIKSTQGSGMNYICTDKSKINKQDIIKATKGYTLTNYFYSTGREWVYKDIKPKIIVEKFLGQLNKVPKDYKIYCFDGEPFMIQVDIDRFQNEHRENYYDIDWNLLDVMDLDCPSNSSYAEPAPKVLPDMLKYARILSNGFPHVRVDFYLVDNINIVFGELTFFTACGMSAWSPKEFDLILGNKIKLPK